MKIRQFFCLAIALSVFGASSAFSGPILKPRKYYGPIPRSSLSLRVGFHGGSSNEEMWTKLDALADERGGQAFSDDFGNAVTIDGTYTYKLHPQFAIRANGSLTMFRSDSRGFYVPMITEIPDTLLLPVYSFTRRFNVELFMLESSFVYYFTDAGINEFQPYFGGGFGLGVPRATYKEGLVIRSTGAVVSNDKDTDWSLEAVAQGFLGALYYLKNTLAFNMEARYQRAQSKFPIVIPTVDGNQRVRFDVDYTGFILNVGAVWAF